MNKYIKNILHPEYFQNKKNNNYFEGWYFKQCTIDNKIISFIPGISRSKNKEHAFIQIIDNINKESYYIQYDINEFEYSDNPFYVKIGSSTFTLNYISLDIDDKISIKGSIYFKNNKTIKKSLYSPNIMGPFSYIPFLECYHGVLSLNHNTSGNLIINNEKIDFSGGNGYIEKDYGTSFPSKYIWLQSNKIDKDEMIFLSIAKIPFLTFSFTGLIGILYINKKEYRFATYNFAKIKKIHKKNNECFICIKQNNYILKVYLKISETSDLSSPNNGEMKSVIKECIDGVAKVKLYYKKKVIYNSIYNNCSIEYMW